MGNGVYASRYEFREKSAEKVLRFIKAMNHITNRIARVCREP
jgi:hypothetical protein